MNIRDLEYFGEEISRTVQEAVNSRDFSRLNQTINQTVSMAAEQFVQDVRRAGDAAGQGIRRAAQSREPRPADFTRPSEFVPLYRRTTSIHIQSIFLMILGGVMGGCFAVLAGILALGTAGLWMVSGGAALAGPLVSLLIAASGFAIFAAGRNRDRKVKHFQLFNRIIEGREYCNIQELTEKSGFREKQVRKDLKWMIEKKWYLQGHLDAGQTCLITSDRMYRHYQDLELRRRQMKEEEERRREEMKEQKSREEAWRDQLSWEVRKVVEAGDAYVEKIHACNDAIPGVEISRKIERMELLVDRIFDRVEQNPEMVGDVRRLMDYYLPTAIKLLEAYEELDAQPVAGENILASKKEIEDTLDTLNTAFEKLLDGMFQDTAWDISSDITVLHTVLAQEGLVDDGMKTGR